MTKRPVSGWLPDVDAPPDAVDRLYAGTLDGIVLESLLSAEECAACMAHVAAYGDWQFVYLDPLAPKSIGIMLAPSHVYPSGPPPEVYFADVDRDNAWVRQHLSPLLPRLEDRLVRMAGGRRVGPLDRPRPHRLATVRKMGIGYGAPMHIDAYRETPGLATLFAHTDRATQLSWYVLLQGPGAAGELEVHARATGEQQVIPLRVGDGVLFDGARLKHRVTNVEAAPERVTVGGFAGLASGRDEFYFWG